MRGLSVAIFAFALWATGLWSAPEAVSIQGTLYGADGPLTGERAWRMRYYDAATTGSQLGGEQAGTLTVASDGLWSIAVTPPTEALNATGAVWYELAIESEVVPDGVLALADVLPDRVRVGAVMFARRAEQAATADTSTTATFATQADFATRAAQVSQATQADSATIALFANESTTAAVALRALDAHRLDGATSGMFATDVELVAGLNRKADTNHTHDFNELRGSATDAQVDNDLTISRLGSVDASAINVGTLDSARLRLTDDDIPDTITADRYLPLESDNHVVPLLTPGMSNTERAAALLAAYAEAQTLAPAADNRVVVIVPPGTYDLETGALRLDTPFVDLIGLTTNRAAQHIVGVTNGRGTGVVEQTTDSVRIENLTIECGDDGFFVSPQFNSGDPAGYFPDSDSPNTVIRNCHFLDSDNDGHSMRIGVIYSGRYEQCESDDYSFGFGGTGGATGVFVDCRAAVRSFGFYSSGTFINCVGGIQSFGGSSGRAGGTFIRCESGNDSFGRISSGVFRDCVAESRSFGYIGTASGDFLRCRAGSRSFGGLDEASGTFRDCLAGDSSFGGLGGTASGEFIGCEAGSNSFGNVVSGVFRSCVGGDGSFGGASGDATGARFYFCEGGANSFSTNGSPTVIHCVRDGVAYP